MNTTRAIKVLALLLPCAVAHAHVHGVATLEIAIEVDKIELNLVSPLENLLGFEHAPRTEAQRTAMREMEKALARPEPLLIPTAAARCALASADVSSNIARESAPHEPAAAGKPPAGAKALAGAEPHGELDARYVFRCQQPDALKSIEVRMFQRFPRLHRVDVRVVGPRGQKAGRVTPAQRTFAW